MAIAGVEHWHKVSADGSETLPEKTRKGVRLVLHNRMRQQRGKPARRIQTF